MSFCIGDIIKGCKKGFIYRIESHDTIRIMYHKTNSYIGMAVRFQCEMLGPSFIFLSTRLDMGPNNDI